MEGTSGAWIGPYLQAARAGCTARFLATELTCSLNSGPAIRGLPHMASNMVSETTSSVNVEQQKRWFMY
jgi:hypothetical protein